MASLALKSLFGVAGKTVAVTGGSRGIGFMIASGFVQNGAHVVITARSADQCEAAAAELNAMAAASADDGDQPTGSCVALPGDLSTVDGCDAFAAQVAETFTTSRSMEPPALNVLVNNSGTSWGAPLEKFPEAGWDKIMDLNVKAPFFLTKACLPLLRAGATPDDPARVINVGSIAGIRGMSTPTYSYDVSKASIHMLTQKLGHDLAHGAGGHAGGGRVTVNAIAPGIVPSAMSSQLQAYATEESLSRSAPLGRQGRPADMAGAALFLASEAGAWITGTTVSVDGGCAALPLPIRDDDH